MIKEMVTSLEVKLKENSSSSNDNGDDSFINNLILGVKTKKYIPIMKRQRCGMEISDIFQILGIF